MVGNPLDRLSADVAAAGRDLEHLDEPAREFSGQLAGAVRQEAPYVTGTLVRSVFFDAGGVGVGAVYGGVVNDANPYVDRAVGRVDPLDVFGAFVDDVLDHHLQPLYL